MDQPKLTMCAVGGWWHLGPTMVRVPSHGALWARPMHYRAQLHVHSQVHVLLQWGNLVTFRLKPAKCAPAAFERRHLLGDDPGHCCTQRNGHGKLHVPALCESQFDTKEPN